MKCYGNRDPMELDRLGGYFCRHMQALTAENLTGKDEIAEELGWRDSEIDRLKREVLLLRTDATAILNISAAKAKIERLRSAAKGVLSIWDDLYSNQADPGEVQDWEALRKVLSET